MSEDIDKHVMVKHGKQFSELCEPIFQNTSINYIGLAKLYYNGARSYLISNPEWGKVLLKNKYHLAGTEDALVAGSDASYQLWSISSMFSLNQQTANLFADCVANNYGNGITLIERGKDFVEFFHICADSGYDKIDPFLSNHIDSLWNYVLYIRESLAQDKILKNAYNKKYHYDLILPEVLSGSDNKNHLAITNKKYYLGGYFNDVYFTAKEIICLILLFQNCSTKEIANKLNLSLRTVEFYLENIKQKAQCVSKTNLILELSRNNLFQCLVKKTAK